MYPNRVNHYPENKAGPTDHETYLGPRRQHYIYTKCQFCINIFKWLPVVFISSVLLWGYYAYVIQLCLFNIESVILKIICLVIFHFLYFMTFWSYGQTIFTKPGDIPKKFWLTTRDNERLTMNNDRRGQIIQQIVQERGLPLNCHDTSGGLRVCDKCNIIKPDRAHHCSACNACVLKMDHHCPWVNNCVSFTNYKFFVLFLGYAFFLCLFTAASSFHQFLLFWRNQLTNDGRFHILFLFFVSIMFAISLVSLFGYHIYLVTLNRSTVESFRPPIFRLGPDKNAYNLGRFQNWVQIFGKCKLKWFIPIYTSLGDGVVFATKNPSDGFDSRFRQTLSGPLYQQPSNEPYEGNGLQPEDEDDPQSQEHHQSHKTNSLLTSQSDANVYKSFDNSGNPNQPDSQPPPSYGAALTMEKRGEAEVSLGSMKRDPYSV